MKQKNDVLNNRRPRSSMGEEFASDLDVESTQRQKWRRCTLPNFSIFMFGVISTSVFTFVTANWTWTRNLDSICSLHTSQSWSPVLRDVQITYSTVTFNGSFAKDTVYRQSASPEVDQAWRDLGIDYVGVLVPFDDASRTNIKSNRVFFNESYGGPGYPGIIEVFHQLHCLDVIRKSAYFNYDYYLAQGQGPFKRPDELRSHVGHCVDTIRQQLMCTADTGIHPFIFVGDPPLVFPDFNRDHKCKNFEDIRAWAEEHQGNFGTKARFQTPRANDLILEEIP